MKISIEPLQLSELVSFLRQQANDSFPDLKDEQRLNTLAEKWYSSAEFCTCREEGRLVGMVAFYANGQVSEYAYIPHVYVSPVYRCKGLFKQMLRTVENCIRLKGYHEIRLEVQKGNVNALKSYGRTGFVKVGVENSQSVFLKKSV